MLSKDEKNEGWENKLNKSSNLGEKELPKEIHDKINELKIRTVNKLESSDAGFHRALSAELNGLYGIIDIDNSNISDIHYLTATDTAIGQAAAEVIRVFLKSKNIYADIFTPKELNTASVQNFSHGMKNLLKWCQETIPDKAQSGYEIIFNITAAFKSLQGYLNIFGMFYADRIAYIFEGSSTLLSIPKLPIKIDQDALERHALALALLRKGAKYPVEELKEIPDALLFYNEAGDVSLSPWGQLLWDKMKKDVFSKTLLGFPYLRYTQSFRDDFKNADVDLKIRIQETLAEASVRLMTSDGDPISMTGLGLRYSKYADKKTNDGKAVAHFRINDSERISCVRIKRGLLLRRCGAHDKVNNDP